MDLYPLRGVDDPTIIADALVGHQAPRQLPAGEVVLAEITADATHTLRKTPAELHDRRRDVRPCLVGVVHSEDEDGNRTKGEDETEADEETADEALDLAHDLAQAYTKTVLVAEDNREWIPDLVPFVPALFHQSARDITGIGSARMITVDVSDCPPDPGILVPDLRARNGKPLHPIAAEPELFAFTAPDGYTDIVHSAFDSRGPIIGRGSVSHDRITVVGFSFQEPQVPVASGGDTETETDGWAPDLPRPPTEQTRTPTNPLVVQIKRSVLDEIAAHVAATPDLEVYGALYADPHDRISHYHPIESESHVLRTNSSVEFQSEFADHMRTLAQLYEGIGCRLCGDCHSHPGGVPLQSEQDERTARNIWRSDRNTCLIAGIADGDGPATWERVDGEVRKQIGDYVVRIAAYSGTTKEKAIRIIGPDSEQDRPTAEEDSNSTSSGPTALTQPSAGSAKQHREHMFGTDATPFHQEENP